MLFILVNTWACGGIQRILKLKWFACAIAMFVSAHLLLVLADYPPYVNTYTDLIQVFQEPGVSISRRAILLSEEVSHFRAEMNEFWGKHCATPPPSSFVELRRLLRDHPQSKYHSMKYPCIANGVDYYGRKLHYKLDFDDDDPFWTIYIWSDGINQHNDDRLGDDVVFEFPGVACLDRRSP